MEFLVFQLQAPMASWGEAAVGEYRGSAPHPGQSALVGLLGAALGLDRADEAAHAALRDGYGFAVGVLGAQGDGRLLRDYHTAQVPPRSALKGRPHATRRDELAMPKRELGTILSTRDYRQNVHYLIAVALREGATAPHTLAALAQALRTPRFHLYLGRKTCAPAAPLWPQVVEATSAHAAMQVFGERFEAQRQQAQAATQAARPQRWVPEVLEPLPSLTRLHFDAHIPAGVPAWLNVPRKDRLMSRRGWQFGDRTEFTAWLAEEEPPCS